MNVNPTGSSSSDQVSTSESTQQTPSTTQTKSTSSTSDSEATYSTWDQLPEDFKQKYMQSVAQGICDKMRKAQERYKQIMREGYPRG